MKIGVPTWTAWTALAGLLVGAIWGIAIIAPRSSGNCTTTVVNGVTTITGGGTCSISSSSGSLVGAIVFVGANSLVVTLIFLAAGVAARFIGKRIVLAAGLAARFIGKRRRRPHQPSSSR